MSGYGLTKQQQQQQQNKVVGMDFLMNFLMSRIIYFYHESQCILTARVKKKKLKCVH